MKKLLQVIKNINSKIAINGTIFNGNSITITSDSIIVDGNSFPENSKLIKVEIVGDVSDLQVASGDVHITGDCKRLESNSGDIQVGGNVESVKSTSGDIEIAGSVLGTVRSVSGDINIKENED